LLGAHAAKIIRGALALHQSPGGRHCGPI
jgi:hypothetical protein